MLTIDGSLGEGGGQILRSALALSLATGTPFRIQRIRARRKQPGLRQQHLTSVLSAARIGAAEVRGAGLGSQDLTFTPQTVQPGRYQFSVGTAGSTMLVLQTVLPPLLLAGGPSELTLEGGTHNPHAPPFDFLAKTFLPLVNRMGPTVTAVCHRAGFYPRGGGSCAVSIQPALRLVNIDCRERGAVLRTAAVAVVASLPRHIAERELDVVSGTLRWTKDQLHVVEMTDAIGPGNVLMLEVESEHATEVFTGFGERGVRAEDVARKAVQEARRYLDADVPVGEHLADQLVLPMALAGGGAFTTLPLTQHTLTNIEVVKMFLNINVSVTKIGPDQCRVEVGP